MCLLSKLKLAAGSRSDLMCDEKIKWFIYKMVSKEVNDFVKSLVASESGFILAFIIHKKYLFHPSKYILSYSKSDPDGRPFLLAQYDHLK